MSAEDETFDIDLYGDEEEEAQPYEAPTNAVASQRELHNDADKASGSLTSSTNRSSNEDKNFHRDATHSTAEQSAEISRTGSKRKAADDASDDHELSHDERPLDQGAQVSLKLTELQWWTTEEEIRHFCALSNTEAELVEVAFGEHKQNGKSKGEAYLEFKTPQAAGQAKKEFEKANAELDAQGKAAIGMTKISVWYTAPGNPFRVREGQGKKEVNGGKFGQQGAYNNYNSHNRGGFSGRGRGAYNPRGGWSNQSTNINQYNNNNNSGMMGGYGNMGFAGFPAMAMNQNAMMNMMSGGFNLGAMGMGMPGMMAGRGGANVVNRGGWNGNMANGNYQQNGHANGWDANKKPRT